MTDPTYLDLRALQVVLEGLEPLNLKAVVRKDHLLHEAAEEFARLDEAVSCRGGRHLADNQRPIDCKQEQNQRDSQ